MNELKIFNFEENEVRTIVVNDEPFFVANDVAKTLGYTNPSKATNDHCKKGFITWGNDSLGRPQQFKLIPESDVYRLVFRSKLPEAEKFENWVMEEVIPSIRKNGSYQVPMSQEDIMIATLETQKELKSKITSIASDVEELKTSIHVTASQRNGLKRKINSSVAHHLGGRRSDIYIKLAKKAYSEVYRQLWNYFDITSYTEVPKIKFDDAIQLIGFWVPSAELRMEIATAQNQIEMEV